MRVRWVALVCLLSAAACASSASKSGGDDGERLASAGVRGTTAEQPAPPVDPASVPRVRITPPKGPPVEVTVEVVQTPREMQRGLMYREHLAPDAGMLFLMGEERVQTFWMRNTLIPLDMIFIGRDRRIVGIVERTKPLTDSPRTVGKPSLYVLEVNGGYAAEHGLAAGDRVEFIGITKAPATPR